MSHKSKIASCCLLITVFCGIFFEKHIRGFQQGSDLTADVKLADPQLFLRFDSLIQAGKTELAAEAIALLIEQDRNSLATSQIHNSDAIGDLFIPINVDCHRRLAAATKSPGLLRAYRDVVDLQAKRLLVTARAKNDIAEYQRLLNKYYLSSFGDEAMHELAALYLEQANHAQARMCLLSLLDENVRTTLTTKRPNWPVFPGTHLQSAELVAVLALISILGDNQTQATREIDWLKQNSPSASGMIAGIEGNYLSTLDEIQSKRNSRKTPDRPTDRVIDIDPSGNPVWLAKLDKSNETRTLDPVDIHPVAVENGLVWHDHNGVRALRLDTGTPLIPTGGPEDSDPMQKGKIWEAQNNDQVLSNEEDPVPRAATISHYGSKVFAIVSNRASEQPCIIVGLDLAKGAKLLPGFPISVPERTIRFVGTPRYDGQGLFVSAAQTNPGTNRIKFLVMRFELPAARILSPLRPTWVSHVCESDVVDADIATSTLCASIQLDRGILYCSTNLGVIGAVDSLSGNPIWMLRYPRLSSKEIQSQPAQRTASSGKFVIDEGNLFVAPSDSRHILSLDCLTGREIWHQTVDDIDYIIGTTTESLICSGRRTVWLNKLNGRFQGMFPKPTQSARRRYVVSESSVGQGQMTPGAVLVPFRDRIFKFSGTPNGTVVGDRRVVSGMGIPYGIGAIDLTSRGIEGGNLFVNNQSLLIINDNGIFAYNNTGRPAPAPSRSEPK